MFFTKTKRDEKPVEFVGRHQQVCLVKYFLGEEIPELNLQIAKNKDLSERNEIMEKLEDIERYIKSEFYTTDYDVSSTFDSIKKIIDEGFASHVLQNDGDLEARCFEIYENVIEYSINKGKKDGALTDGQITSLRELPGALRIQGILSEMDGGDFDSPLESHVWLAYFSLQSNYYTSGLIATILAGVSEKEVAILVPKYILAINKLRENNKIDKGDEQRLIGIIERGLQENKRIQDYRQYLPR